MPGSKGARASPGLIAACHVLHRLLPPRHPPDALWHLIALKPMRGGEYTHTTCVFQSDNNIVVSRFALRNQRLYRRRTNPSIRCKIDTKHCGLELGSSCEPRNTWWSQTESNRRPLECKSSALPTELWPQEKVTYVGVHGGPRRT